MDHRVAQIAARSASELVWLLEHPSLYTAGTSAKDKDLLTTCFPVFKTGRGGQFTYHGPGQRIAYLMLDVKARYGPDVRAFVQDLEAWIIEALSTLGIASRTVPGRVGVWVGDTPESEAKIAALGVRIRQGISLHGVSLNVTTDLSHYSGIVPCGIADRGVTSIADLKNAARMTELDKALRTAFERRFSPVHDIAAPIVAQGIAPPGE